MPDTSARRPEPTLIDLQHCGADELLDKPTQACAYHEMYARLVAVAYAAPSDSTNAAALTFLTQICSMMLEPDDRSATFKPMMTSAAGRTMLPEDLTPADVDLIADLAPAVQHPLLRARLADLVWLKDRRRGVTFAHMAIEGYRQLHIDNRKWGYEVVKCRQRAIQLAHSTGKGGSALSAELADELLGTFWKAFKAGDHVAARHYLRPLQTEGLARDHAGHVAEALEQEARRQLQADDSFGSLLSAESAVVWFARARDPERRAAAQILVAESWVAQADQDGSGMMVHHCYTKAIDAYQLVSAQYRANLGAADAIAQLRAKLPAAGQDMLARMKTMSHRFDISDLVADAIGKVQGLPPNEALFAF
jgi:hypothetical protein